MTINIANKKSKTFIKNKEAFKGSNFYAKDVNYFYLVYSYRDSYPIAAYNFNTAQWLINEDKFSVSTSRHQFYVRQALSLEWSDVIKVSTQQLLDVLHY